MANRKPFIRRLAGFKYHVLPKVYKGGTDTKLFCKIVSANVSKGVEVWDIGTGTGLVALQAKRNGAKYVLATDLNPQAVKNARENSKLLKSKIDIRQTDVFGKIKKKFDIITFNSPFTDHKTEERYQVCFWDENHKTLRRFLSGIRKYLKSNGRVFIAWASFADLRELRRITNEYNFTIKEAGRETGDRGFIYYIFELIF